MCSRQRLWQSRMCASGRCERCGRKRRHYGHYCDRCHRRRNVYLREWARANRRSLETLRWE